MGREQLSLHSAVPMHYPLLALTTPGQADTAHSSGLAVIAQCLSDWDKWLIEGSVIVRRTWWCSAMPPRRSCLVTTRSPTMSRSLARRTHRTHTPLTMPSTAACAAPSPTAATSG
jgi:hypothetical protein